MTTALPRPPRFTSRNVSRRLGATAAIALAIALCFLLAQLAYGFYEIYGPTENDSMFNATALLSLTATAAPFVLPVAAIVTGLAVLAFRLLNGRGRKVPVMALLGVSLLLTAMGTIAGAALGTQAKRDGVARMDAACSPDERDVLVAFGAAPMDGQFGLGDPDGSCRAVLSISLFDNEAEIATLHDRIIADGWTPTGPRGDTTTYVKKEKTLEVVLIRDKGMEVTLRIR